MIQIIGGIVGTSGYAIHTRNLANALNKLTEVKLKCHIPQGFERELNDQELTMIKRLGNPTHNIIIDLPINWRLHTERNMKNIGFLVWEGDKIPTSFINEIENKDIEMIFVPSEHTKKAILNTYQCTKPIHIVPHGVDLNNFFPTEKPSEFTFIVNKGFRNNMDRGGTQFAIRAFIEEFKRGEAKLIVKINPAYPVENLQKSLWEIGARPESPEIRISADYVPDNKMHNFYNLGHVFLAPTMAEGYHLGCIEAMACGLPCITTNFGGQTDYVNEWNGWIIGGELKEVKHDLFYEGVRWLNPSISELREAMRDAYNSWSQDVNFRSEKALQDARNNTWDHTAKKVIDILSQGNQGG